MIFKVTFRSRAKYDVEDIELYYHNISQKLLDSFSDEFHETIDHIIQEPLLYQLRYRDVHFAPLKRFPYGIHYQIEKDTIVVLRVLHTSRYFE